MGRGMWSRYCRINLSTIFGPDYASVWNCDFVEKTIILNILWHYTKRKFKKKGKDIQNTHKNI